MMRNTSGFIGTAMRNRHIVLLIVFLLMVLGVAALLRMPRNEYPEFTIRQGLIVGLYPGATSEEVEDQLTRSVENYLFGYQEVDKAKTYSYSREGALYVFVELNGRVKNADLFWSKLRHGLNDLKMTLPAGVVALFVNSDFGDTAALLITLSSDTRSYRELEEQLERLGAECRKIPDVSKIKHYGLQQEKIYIHVNPALLNEYNIKSLSLLGAYQLEGAAGYAGTLEAGGQELAVHLPPSFRSEEDLAGHIVYADPEGHVLRLRDIAVLERRVADPDNYIEQNGRRTLLLSLEMQPGNNIVQFGRDVDKTLERFRHSCPDDIAVEIISELPRYVRDAVNNFLREFLTAILAVVLVPMLLLPLRVAAVAALTVPVTVLITLAILYLLGVELHTVSLASLIVVLGMIVDNSIVVIDNHLEKIGDGGSSWHAAIRSARELLLPMFTATLAIYAAYVPLNFFLTGTAREFIETIPVVVGVSLAVSILVAVFAVPYLNFLFIRKGLKKAGSRKSGSVLEGLQGGYDRSLEWVFRHPKSVMGATLLLIAGSIYLLATLDRQLFPEVERNQFAVEIHLPTGASLESTAAVVDSMARLLRHDERVTNVTSFIGTSSPRFHTVYAPNMPAPNFGQLLVNTISSEATIGLVEDYGPRYAGHFPGALVHMRILALQPGREAIELRISSDSIGDIRRTEVMVREILARTGHIAWVRDDWDQKRQGIYVDLDRDRANRMGYTRGYLSASIAAGLDGLPLTTIWENDYPVEVRLVQVQGGPVDIGRLENQYITSPMSYRAVPLRSIASFRPQWTEGTIAHRNGIRTLTLHVINERDTRASAIFNRIRPEIEALPLPEGTTITFGGEYEGQQEVFIPMARALAASVMIIFFILLFEFRRVKLTVMIMSTMLLVLPGAAIGLKLMGYPFSLTSFLGITSLCGIVVRNGVILIDYLSVQRREHRRTVYQSALAAGRRRLRPIFLTSVTTAVGVVTMILSRSLLWGPLGTVICFGLMIGMVLTLYVLPLTYWLVYRHEDERRGSGKGAAGRGVKPIIAGLVLLLGTVAPALSQVALSLDSCRKITLACNPQIRNSRLVLEASEAAERSAFTAYFPEVSAVALGFRFSDPLLKFDVPGGNLPVYNGDPATLPQATEFAYSPGASIATVDHLYAGALTAVQPLYTGGRVVTANRLARLGSEVSEQKQLLSMRDALFQTEEQYWQIVALQEKMHTVEAYQQLLDTLLRDVRVAFDAGLVSYNDVLRVSLRQGELKMERLQLENGIRLASMALCRHLGMDFSSGLTPADTVPALEAPFGQYADPQQAVGARAEYRLALKNAEAGRLQRRLVLGEHLPQIGIGAGAFAFDAQDEWSRRLMAFGTLSLPLSGWWGGSYRIREQRLKEQMAQNSADDTARLLRLELEKAWTGLTEAWQRIGITEEGLVQARESLKITSDHYRAGTVGIADLLETQALYRAASDRLTEAKCAYLIASAEYRRATDR